MKAISGAASRQFTGAITTLAFIAPSKSSKINVAVLAEIGDALARLDAEGLKRVGDAVGLDIEFSKTGWRPSKSKAMALPRFFARARTISARFAGSPEVETFLPNAYLFVARSLVSSRAKDNTPMLSLRKRDPYAAALSVAR